MDAIDVIRTKRDSGELSPEQIKFIIDTYTAGNVGDEQFASLLMAIFLNGMNRRELVDWTNAMIESGVRMDFSNLGAPTADKHSTGGVGDKISLILGPLVAAFGVKVPMLSGRGLGHTGGTLDKLEAISGFDVNMTSARMDEILKDVGVIIAAAGSDLAPADKRIYALRDVTATVDAIPLIASSIMSKKIAAGAGSLVLDVKVGTGAFMKDLAQAKELAETMVSLGNDAGVPTSAVLTDMSTPLGLTIGNSLEIEETFEVLAGGGPSDVRELTVEFARRMLNSAGQTDVDVAAALDDGRAMDVFKRMIRAQGGDPEAPLPYSENTHEIVADRDGYITTLDALAFGVGSWRLGAGRARKEDDVQLGAGIRLHAIQGEKVTKGQKIATLYTDTPAAFEPALESVMPGLVISDSPSAERQIILDTVD
ncbi:Thymidine phosphorylase [Corynebacterium kutscheri]|uniref:Thymidine phosphorylase n=1 Tax=Corynebacterium kutscheri TaxID=35755 RepID=A0AB38VT35_9CORY|nr:thymidine phosphorylase [Corynebacterium kutscheri]VEH07049.1 Thymidine phosphorylase [Corynebacterium kutscheri]VEH79545.1 Thymidine phosphorylase [Corynebacterium kutscheri]